MIGDRAGLSMAKLNYRHKAKIRKRKRIRFFTIIFILVMCCPLISTLKETNIYKAFKNKNINSNLYNFMKDGHNRDVVYQNAIKLNNGSSANTCVYFISETLRQCGEKIDSSICNTAQLLNTMEKDGWKREGDYKKLKPGDICFTTNGKLDKDGIPTHTYIFMGWKKEGNYDYAYICDNQAKDYDGKIYHIRNITKTERLDGNIKEPFSFFLYR